MQSDMVTLRTFPTAAGILFSLGLGGFFDGIVLHQLLQWHHMLSSWYPINSIENLKLNTTWDGLFHAATYLFVVAGLFLLWRTAHHFHWSNQLLIGTVLFGWGIFNFVEGIVDHEILGIHHVNETVSETKRPYWDLAFLLWALAMIGAGWALMSRGKRESGTWGTQGIRLNDVYDFCAACCCSQPSGMASLFVRPCARRFAAAPLFLTSLTRSKADFPRSTVVLRLWR